MLKEKTESETKICGREISDIKQEAEILAEASLIIPQMYTHSFSHSFYPQGFLFYLWEI